MANAIRHRLAVRARAKQIMWPLPEPHRRPGDHVSIRHPSTCPRSEL